MEVSSALGWGGTQSKQRELLVRQQVLLTNGYILLYKGLNLDTSAQPLIYQQ